MEDLVNQIAAGGISVYVLQWIKNRLASWGIAQKAYENIMRGLAALAAALAMVGIQWSYNPDGGVLTITGLTYISIGTFLFEWVKQYVIQHAAWLVTKASGGKTITAITNGG